MATSVDSVLFTSKTYSNGEHPIALRVTKDRATKYMFLGYSCPKDLWDSSNGLPKKKHPQKIVLDTIISKLLSQAKDILMRFDLEEISYEASHVIRELGNKKSTQSLFELYEAIVSRMVNANRIGNSNAYKDSLRAIKLFTGGKDKKISDITFTFLTEFEAFYLTRGVKKNTIGAYLRILRAVVNEAIKSGLLRESNYPFKNFKLGRLKNKPEHRALRKEQIETIENLEVTLYSKLWLAKVIFLFSYYNQGINFIDLAQLQWEGNISEGRLNYVRSKTKDQFSIKLNERSLKILAQLEVIRVDGFIFPILLEERHKTELQKNNRVKKVIKDVNSNLKDIALQCGIQISLTTYVSRHSYATVLKRAGVSTAIISESLGHETESVTQHYLDSFENSVIDSANEYL